MLCAFGLTLAMATTSAAQPATRNVLLLKSFDRDPFTTYADMFRAELSRRSPEPLNVFEVSIQPAPFEATPEEEPVVNYLRAVVAGRRVDLVVSIGGPSAVFAQKYRETLFPTTPLVQAAVDRRWLENQTLDSAETAVPAILDLPRVLDDMLVLLPETRNVFVVIGTSQFENFWRKELEREFVRLQDRLTFTWFNNLSFPQMLERAAALPPHSAIFYTTLSVDGNGVLQSEQRSMAQLHAVANAPIFGIFDYQLGRGVVGGPLISVTGVSRDSADIALRILHGESPGDIRLEPRQAGQPAYDWRELKKWGISESRIPAGSVVQFRQPGLWEQYQGYIVSALLLVGLQSALIGTLLVQRARRARAEQELRESEERFRLMANGLPVMVWTARPDTTLDFVNDTIVTFTGSSAAKLLDNGWLEHIHPDDVEPCRRIYVPAVETRQPFQMEYRLRRADGAYRWILDNGVPRYEPNGSYAGYLGSSIDITERREMEQSLLANEAALRHSYEQNQDLAGRLIHAQEAERTRIARDLHDDVSQQLAGVGIMLSGLKRHLHGADVRREVDEAVGSLQERTATLAKAIRHLSHDLHPGVLKHAGLVAALAQHCGEVQRHHGLEVRCTARDDVDELDFDVAICLYRVTQEALANVVRHARAHAASVDLQRTAGGIQLLVSDDGIGFVATDRVRSGLGLRSMDERVRLAGGELHVESQVGKGTNLRVQLPLSTGRVDLVRVS